MKNLVYLCTLKPSSHRTAEESLGLGYLARSLENAGYETIIRDLWLDDTFKYSDLKEEILKNKDKILFVGTSSYMLNNQPTCELLKFLNNNGIKTASGGYGPTFEPEVFLENGANLVMIGEGEAAIVEVADYFMGKKDLKDIKSIVYKNDDQIEFTEKRELFEDLNQIPFPKRPYLNLSKKRKSTINVLSSRGCMGHCSFCSIAANIDKQKGKRWRGRSVDNIILELKELQSLGVKYVKFVDDSFLENERDALWCKEFLNKIKENKIDMTFRASIRADKVDEESLKYLKEAGFFSYSCGLENGSVSALKRMHKLASIKDNERAINVFKKLGLYMQAGFILFDNKTTIQELNENLKFLTKNIDLVSKGIFSEMYAAVGTTFTNKNAKNLKEKFCANNLYLIEDEKARQVYENLKKWQRHHSKVYDMVIDPISAPKAIPVEEMKKYHKLMVMMKKVDLAFMKDTIVCVSEEKNVEDVYNNYEKKYSRFFNDIFATVNELYKKDGLIYDANINGFLLSNKQKS